VSLSHERLMEFTTRITTDLKLEIEAAPREANCSLGRKTREALSEWAARRRRNAAARKRRLSKTAA
jgi:hypothetical protein